MVDTAKEIGTVIVICIFFVRLIANIQLFLVSCLQGGRHAATTTSACATIHYAIHRVI